MTSQENGNPHQTLLEFTRAWARKDLDALMQLVTEDCVYSASVGPEPGSTWRGHENVREGFRRMLAQDAGARLIPGDVHIVGDLGCAEWSYQEDLADGTIRETRGCDLLTFRGNKISIKNAFRKVSVAAGDSDQLHAAARTVATGAPETALATYQPRHYEQLGIWEEGPFRLKAYAIRHDGVSAGSVAASRELIAAARAHSAKRLIAAAGGGHHHGLGFVVLHAGLVAHWLLVDWWAHGDICCHLLSRSEHQSPLDFRPESRPLLGCVWELPILSFERDAWVKTMLRENPDSDAYLANRFPEGVR